MLKVKIGEKNLGQNCPVYIVAEAGSNHNQNFNMAIKLIDAAVQAQADAVKFQLFRAKQLYPRKAKTATYLAKKYENIFDLMKSMEMPVAWIEKLAKYCHQKKIDFLCTPFDEQTADILQNFVLAYKIASSECNHTELIAHIAKKNTPIILATGLAQLGEIDESVNLIREYHDKIILMHTIINYPARIEDTNLLYIKYLKNIFNCPCGLSDHSQDPIILPVASTVLGSNIIEKHFTLNKNLPGPDHQFGIDPAELKALVKAIRLTEASLLFRQNKILEIEKEFVKVSKRAIQSTRNIQKGDKLTKKNIAILRPGKGVSSGLEPKYYNLLLNKIVNQNINNGDGVTWNHLLNT